jgi:hypothetical protein
MNRPAERRNDVCNVGGPWIRTGGSATAAHLTVSQISVARSGNRDCQKERPMCVAK